MRSTLNQIRVGLVGVAAGLMFAVIYLRGRQSSSDSLDELRDGAILILGIATAISFYLARPKRVEDRR